MSLTMKRIILAFAVIFVLAGSFSVSAQTQGQNNTQQTEQSGNSEEEDLDLYYINLPIVKIFTHPKGYYILYRSSNLKIGKLYVPWEWMDFRDQRAIYDTVGKGVNPYISYITNNGSFYQLRIKASANLFHPTWGVIGSSSIPDENFDVDSLNIIF